MAHPIYTTSVDVTLRPGTDGWRAFHQAEIGSGLRSPPDGVVGANVSECGLRSACLDERCDDPIAGKIAMMDRSFAALVCAFVLTYPSGLAGSRARDLVFTRDVAGSVDCEPVARCDLRAGKPRAKPIARLPDATIVTELSECSPFSGFDGYRELDFDLEKGVVTETIDPPPCGVGARNSTPIEIAGSFLVKARTGRVVVAIGGVRREYTLVVPVESGQCILAFGGPKTVDLKRSWFAAFSDEPDADPPEYQHATKRQSPLGRAVVNSGSKAS